MGTSSSIEWTEATWNPTTGCDQVSPGCDNCYALRLARRLKAMNVAKYQQDGSPTTSGPGFGLTLHESTLAEPMGWRRGRMVFVNSMSDLFHPRVPIEFIHRVFATMAATPQHTNQILTKRSQRLAEVAAEITWPSNVWMGVSVETDRYLFRADHLRSVPAAVRFLSCEPLLGPLKGLDLDKIDWVITGGESGPGARPVDPTWVREIRDACVSSETAFFHKQWGGATAKAGGRELDGLTWGEYPRRRVGSLQG